MAERDTDNEEMISAKTAIAFTVIFAIDDSNIIIIIINKELIIVTLSQLNTVTGALYRHTVTNREMTARKVFV